MEGSPTRSKPLIVLALLMLSMAATALAQAEGGENGTDQVRPTNISESQPVGAESSNISALEETDAKYLEWLEQNQWVILVIAALITIIAYVCGFLKYIKNIIFHGRRNRNPEENIPQTEERKSQPSDVSDAPGKISNAPPYLSFNFTGRDKLLADLRAALASNGRVALYGLGGIGKTQLALRYIDQHKSDYEIIWWVKSGEPTTLASDYAELADKLNLSKREDADQKAIIEAIRNCLSKKRDWLLVFDNAEEPASVRSYLPQIDSGQVIITSRDSRDWKSVATPLEVTKFDRKAESIKFLLERTGQNDATAADRLADALGDLPLGLEQAGAYIRSTGESLSRYLELFQERQLEILEKFGPIGDEYPATVATTWDLSFQKARQEVPASADLLNLCAFLAPDDIPKSLLTNGAEHLPERLASAVKDDMALNDAIASLKRYSLLTVADDSLSVHRLVQAVARDRLSEKGQKRWAEAAVQLVKEAFPFQTDDVRTWPTCSVLFPHALAAAIHAEVLQVAPESTQNLLVKTGLYLSGRAQFDKAKNLYEKALPIAENVYGQEHYNVAAIMNNLGSVLGDMGDLEGAKKHLKQALKIDEKALGPNHPNIARDVGNLGGVLYLLGDLAGAKKSYEQALEIDKKVYGPDHPNLAIRVNNLGIVLEDLGDLADAKNSYEQALEIGEMTLGLDHPNVATYVNNLGGVLEDLGDLAGAKKSYERALEIDENAYGPDHPNVARDFNNLGGVLRALDDIEGARENLERALEIFRHFLGEDHPKTKLVQRNLESLRR